MEQSKQDGKILIDRLGQVDNEFRSACLAARDAYAPVEKGGWNVHQLAVHVRDSEAQVYGLRARRTLLEDDPFFPNFDGEAYLAAHYDPQESLQVVLDGFVEKIESLAAMLRAMPEEAWSRPSRHESQGSGLTLKVWVEREANHIEEHYVSVKAAPK